MYCKNCGQNVKPKKKFSVGAFLLSLLFFGVGAILYLLYYFFVKTETDCPICGDKVVKEERVTSGNANEKLCQWFAKKGIKCNTYTENGKYYFKFNENKIIEVNEGEIEGSMEEFKMQYHKAMQRVVFKKLAS